jgi:hypothetical protein
LPGIACFSTLPVVGPVDCKGVHPLECSFMCFQVHDEYNWVVTGA